MSFSDVHAQSCTDIKYTFEFVRNGQTVLQSRYVYNDSFAFFYFYRNNDPVAQATVFPQEKRILGHTKFTDKIRGGTYYRGYKSLFIDSLKTEIWQPTGISKTIMNIPCDGYLRIVNGGDSILAYVSAGMGDGKGLLYYDGIPGVALEIYDQATGYHIIANSIQKTACSFLLPDTTNISKRKRIANKNR